jgi:23S rRNA A1618 N6-methylase RlmF
MNPSHVVRVNRQLQRKLEKIEGLLAAAGLKSEFIKVRRKRKWKTTRTAKRRVANIEACAHEALQLAQDIYWVYTLTAKVIKNWPKIKAWFKSVGLTHDEITTLGLAELMISPQKKRKKAKKRVKR